ncbi:hypothetical protein D3C75_1100350 [compost metagenome]
MNDGVFHQGLNDHRRDRYVRKLRINRQAIFQTVFIPELFDIQITAHTLKLFAERNIVVATLDISLLKRRSLPDNSEAEA